MIENYLWGGITDTGYKREINEDYIHVLELDNNTMFVALADGAGSLPSSLQAGAIAIRDISDTLKRIYDKDKNYFMKYTEYILYEAMNTANRVIGAFKMGDEEHYAGFASCLTCCVLKKDGHFTFAHIGNTRMYLLRVNKDGSAVIKQLTSDHTKAKKLLDEGFINNDQYYFHPDRLALTSALGLVTDPFIQTFDASIKERDFLILTSDGIHYALNPEDIKNIVTHTTTPDDACDGLIKAAKSLKYNDNMSAIVIWYRGELQEVLELKKEKTAKELLREGTEAHDDSLI